MPSLLLVVIPLVKPPDQEVHGSNNFVAAVRCGPQNFAERSFLDCSHLLDGKEMRSAVYLDDRIEARKKEPGRHRVGGHNQASDESLQKIALYIDHVASAPSSPLVTMQIELRYQN
ncbi:MAG TPA: hypothetical protein VNJ31_09385 [Methyloceanibacter sp.]|nr:hypothetical protein [Methyloceanibacter sp.]